ncbi:anti-lipopolysaccharide factor [Procambarus clarkii]|uniref:Anti-lipopolysaccharide factor-like protein n=2 Tax=Procambarus clarkii TaxID=6728 RepID=F1ASU1_PROCL|nr:anti-lipopolysaccharide factor-like [Procambarus clarkii]ADX60063.1 anti-lipopolysaccharide factor-like protein [Procambarus clarkii]
MNHRVVVSLVVVGLLAASFTPQSHAQVLEGLAAAVTGKLAGLWRNGEVELLGHYCSYSVTPTIRRWQLYFRGRMWCPGWTSIRGEAMTRSNSGVQGDTTRDFVTKALNAGLISQQEAQAWLDG